MAEPQRRNEKMPAMLPMRPLAGCIAGLAAVLALGCTGVGAQQQRTAPPADIVQQCVPCHGRDGIAREADVPHLAGQNDVYLYNQMQAFRSGARRHPEMRIITRELDQKQIEALARYFAALPAR
jgi:cytochrome c553